MINIQGANDIRAFQNVLQVGWYSIKYIDMLYLQVTYNGRIWERKYVITFIYYKVYLKRYQIVKTRRIHREKILTIKSYDVRCKK